MGTSSVGWAVTDLNYNVQKFNGKAMWGVRLFDEAKTAEERRTFRSGRRRNQRETQRIALLQELFAEEIAKKDFGFFVRLKDSKYYVEDKDEQQPNTLFNDKNFNDKDYGKKYPTIYHLRKELIENKEEHDIRLVYLAIHHILKHRGHFLFDGDFSDVADLELKDLLSGLILAIEQELGFELAIKDEDKAKEILSSDKMGITLKKKAFEEVFAYGKDNDKQAKAIINLIAGGKVALSALFGNPDYDDAEQKSISLADGSFDENESIYRSILNDGIAIIEHAKEVYDWGVLQRILAGEKNISFAKVRVYDEHQADLRMLKKAVREYCPEKYDTIFRQQDGKNPNYSSYIGSYKNKGKNYPIEKMCSQEELCKSLKSILGKFDVDEKRYPDLMSKIENNTLLPKLRTKDNSVIPYQVHEKELKLILENASHYFAFLNKADEKGLSVKDKIISIMRYRIPYYVGPINGGGENKNFYWAVKKSDEPVRPWNFDQVIDLEGSAEEFIKRMTNKCTYVVGADVIPKNSLLYSKFMVLNELNNMTIDGDKPSVEVKQAIFEDLFLTQNKITQKKVKTWLKLNGYGDDCEIAGIDGDFKSSMTSYLDFKHILGKETFTDDEKEMIENIIKYIVLFGDDKKILKSKIGKLYGDKLSETQMSQIMKKKYTGWGRLSEKFLTGIKAIDPRSGEMDCSIIDMMYNSEDNPNLMQLLSKNYGYLDALKECNGGDEEKKVLTYSDVDELYVSPSVKRSIWQTITIVKELTKIMGHAPKKVFIEMARGPEEKKRTISRKKQLLDLYENCKKEEKVLFESLNGLEENKLRNDRLFLYYTQMGKSMYTGKTIDLDELFTKYDIDHIYPQSKIMDDSINNRVLVERELNSKKSDQYPLSADIQNNMSSFWKMLHSKNMISTSKLDRLERKTELSNEELSSFVARQIVETRQSTKAVAKLLAQMFREDSKIVYVKAGNVSKFRQGQDDYAKGRTKAEIDERKRENEFIKVREINDYHHAKDAYLNIVVGNVFDTKFSDPVKYFSKAQVEPYSLNAMYKFDVQRDGIVAWEPTTMENEGTMATVRKYMNKNNILFTRYAKEAKGGFYDQMLMKKGKGQVPIKGSDSKLADINKYGGFNKAAGAYFFLVEHEQKGKLVRTIEFVPLYLVNDLNSGKLTLEEYCKTSLSLINPKIILSKIKFDTLFEVNGFRMHISGRTDNRILFKNGNQLVLKYVDERYIKKIIKVANGGIDAEKVEHDGINSNLNLILYDTLFNKIKNSIYNELLKSQAENIKKARKLFIESNKIEQCMLIRQLLYTFSCDSTATNFFLLGKKSTGKIKVSKNVTSIKGLCLINQSATGLFEKKIEL